MPRKLKSITVKKNNKFIVVEEALDENDVKTIKPFEFFIRSGNEKDADRQTCFIDADVLYDILQKHLDDQGA